LNRKKVTQDMFLIQNKADRKKEMLKNRAKDVFAHTVMQAKVAQEKASITISQEKNEINERALDHLLLHLGFPVRKNNNTLFSFRIHPTPRNSEASGGNEWVFV